MSEITMSPGTISEQTLKKALIKSGKDSDIQFVGLDDEFGFTCTQCGACCMNREDIMITPLDVYNGAKYLGITPYEFLQKYTYGTVGGNTKLPMIILEIKDNGFCSLLEEDPGKPGKFRCSIHDAKPGICSNHPIGVAYQLDKTNAELSSLQYVMVEQCPNSVSMEMHKVRDWVKKYIDNEEDVKLALSMQVAPVEYLDTRQFYSLLQSAIHTFSIAEKMEEMIQKIAKEESIADSPPPILQKAKNLYQDAQHIFNEYMNLIFGLYYNYDTDLPFGPQATHNLEGVRQCLEVIVDIYEILKAEMAQTLQIDIEDLISKDDVSDDFLTIHTEEVKDERLPS